MSATAQVNVRMSAALKRAGDEAFACANISPSEVVRAAYERAAGLSHALRGVSDIVVSDAQSSASEERLTKIERFERSAHVVQDVAKRYNLHVDASRFKPMTEAEVEDAFYQDFLAGESQ